MAKEFNKVIFITHPAFPASVLSGGNILGNFGEINEKESKRLRWTPKQTIDFFNANIRPHVTESNHDTLIVLIKSPPQIEPKTSIFTKLSKRVKVGWLKRFLRDKGKSGEKALLGERRYFVGGSARNERRMNWAEKEIERNLKTMEGVGSRLIVIEPAAGRNSPEEVRWQTLQQMKRRGFQISQSAIGVCYGSYKDQCVTAYPEEIMGSKERLRFPEGGAISFGYREGNFKRRHPRNRNRGNTRKRRA